MKLEFLFGSHPKKEHIMHKKYPTEICQDVSPHTLLFKGLATKHLLNQYMWSALSMML